MEQMEQQSRLIETPMGPEASVLPLRTRKSSIHQHGNHRFAILIDLPTSFFFFVLANQWDMGGTNRWVHRW